MWGQYYFFNFEIDKSFMEEIVFLVEELPEGGYNARAINHSIFIQGNNLSELFFLINDALRCHFDIAEINQKFEIQFV